MAILGLIALLHFLFLGIPAILMNLMDGARARYRYFTTPHKKSDHAPDHHYSDWGQ